MTDPENINKPVAAFKRFARAAITAVRCTAFR